MFDCFFDGFLVRSALCAHPFWKPFNPSPPSDLPTQPAFDTLVRYEHLGLLDSNARLTMLSMT